MSKATVKTENKETLQYLQETQEYIYKLKENLIKKIIELHKAKPVIQNFSAGNEIKNTEASLT